MSRQNDWFATGETGSVTNYVRYLAVYILQHKVTQMLPDVSSEEIGEQTRFIGGELFKEIVCKTNIKITTSSAKTSKQSALKLESWCKTLKAWQLQHLKANLFWFYWIHRKVWCAMSSVSLTHYCCDRKPERQVRKPSHCGSKQQ